MASRPLIAQGYSLAEEVANSISDGIGLVFGIVGLVLLLVQAADTNASAMAITSYSLYGGSMIMLAKGNRSQQVTDACQKYGGFYLGSIGGPAAILAQNNIKSIECVEYPELGMEAIWKIEVENFPAFILVDDKGNDFFKQLKPWNCSK